MYLAPVLICKVFHFRAFKRKRSLTVQDNAVFKVFKQDFIGQRLFCLKSCCTSLIQFSLLNSGKEKVNIREVFVVCLFLKWSSRLIC